MVVRSAATLLAVCLCGTAVAQPAPAPQPQPQPQPQAPQDPYAPDPVLGEQIAEQLVARAQELLDAKMYLDAKQLAVEALVKSPKGTAADRARFIIKTVNQHLDIKEDPPPTPPSETKPTDPVDLTPIHDPTAFDPSRQPPPVQTPDTGEVRDGRTAAAVHGAIYGGTVFATIGAFAGGDNPASVAVPLGIAGGLGTGFLAHRYVRTLEWDEAQIRTAGSLDLWGGMVGGLFGTAVSGAGLGESPSATGVLLGASIGSTAGLLAGVGLARKEKLTRGDVALVDTLAGIGAVGGLTMGMLMQPAENEAYAVNSLLGVAGGVAIGVNAGPQTNTTPRRMLRVAGLAAAGGALPFLLYAGIYDGNSSADERVVGLLSTAGLLGGMYLGFRLTRNMDVGLDVKDGAPSSQDAPAAVVGRNSDGSWGFGGLALSPLSKQLATNQRGMGITLFGSRF
jgi:hypothetical protein